MKRTFVAVVATLLTVTSAVQADELTELSTEFSNSTDLASWSEHAPEGFTPKWKTPRIEDGM